MIFNTSLTVNGRSPWRIVTQWQNPSSGEVQLFESDDIWYNPTPFIAVAQITVYAHPDDLKRYHMDTSFLPKVAA